MNNSLYGQDNVIVSENSGLVDEGRIFILNEDAALNNGESITVDITTTKKTDLFVTLGVSAGLATWALIKDGGYSGGSEVIPFNPNLTSIRTLAATVLKDATIAGGSVILDGSIGTSTGGKQEAEAGFPTKLTVPAGTFTIKLSSLVNGNTCSIGVGLNEL